MPPLYITRFRTEAPKPPKPNSTNSPSKDAGKQPENIVILGTCSMKNRAQKWGIINNGLRLVNSGSLCLDQGNSLQSREPILWACDSNETNQNQIWVMGRGDPPKRDGDNGPLSGEHGGSSDRNLKAGSGSAPNADGNSNEIHKQHIPGEFKLPTGPQPLMSVGKLGRQQNLVEEAKKVNRTGKCLVFDVGNKNGNDKNGNNKNGNINNNVKGTDWKQLPGVNGPQEPTEKQKNLIEYDLRAFNIKEDGDKRDFAWEKGWYLQEHAAGRKRVKMEDCELPRDGSSQRHLWEVMW